MVTLRIAGEHDAYELWKWRNDVSVRRGFGTRAVPYDEHLVWMSEMAENGNKLYIVNDGTLDVGFVCLVIVDGRGEREKSASIRVAITYPCRKMGYGKQAIVLASEAMKKEGLKVYARIREDNYRSLLAFESAGYKENAVLDIDREAWIEMVYA